MQELKSAKKTAFDQLGEEYEKAGQPYELITHPYFSTGAFQFQVVASAVDNSGFTRLVLRCPQQTVIKFFSYAVGDQAQGAGMPATVPATDAWTNIAERQQTNNEDFAVEGISATSRGVRVHYPNAGADWFSTGGLTAVPASFQEIITGGTKCITDLASVIVPPEIGSPLTLQDGLFQALISHCTLVPIFDRKASDRLARLDKAPEGGGKAYVVSNGEPSHHNFLRLHQGFAWRKKNAPVDTLFALNAILEDDVWFMATLPQLFATSTPAISSLGELEQVDIEWTVFLHGRAFYYPSENI